jgi:ankyrin repeat protein
MVALLYKPSLAPALLEQKADVNAVTSCGTTPLQFAVYENRVQAVQLLLNRQAKVSAADDCGRTPLHTATACCRQGIAELLISARADLEAKLVNTPTCDHDGFTPLLYAGFFTSADFVDMLIRNNADVHAKGNLVFRYRTNGTDTILHEIKMSYGLNIIHTATVGGAHDVLEYLLQHGHADINSKTGSHPDYIGSGMTGLHMAALRDKPLLVELCIENGADVNARVSFSDASLSKVDPQWKGKWLPSGDQNVVDMCSYNAKSRACLLALIDAGATLNARNGFGLSSFQRAVGLGAEEMVQILLESVEEGRQQDFVNELNPITGDTALMVASMRLELEMVRLLLSKRADPNIRCFDTDNHDFLIMPTPFYSIFPTGTFNDARPLSFRNLNALAFASIGNSLKLRSIGEKGAEVVEQTRLEVLNTLADAGAVLAPRDCRALALAKDIKSNERVVEWLSSRLPP